jgi:hypothetical protein
VGIDVALLEDPQSVLDRAGDFLGSDPVRHNLILTLLHARANEPVPGRYWVAAAGGDTVGIVFQSPLSFLATLTPMEPDVVEAMVDSVAGANVPLPGVNGEALTAARFAGAWTERHDSGARPTQGQRIYEMSAVAPIASVPGTLRAVTTAEIPTMTAWMESFQAEVGEQVGDPEAFVRRAVRAGELWCWDSGEPMAMAALTEPLEGVVRVRAVFTPGEKRGRGNGTACVAAVSQRALASSNRPILYTDLGNPTSNSIYRRVGYRAVAEVLRYQFG